MELYAEVSTTNANFKKVYESLTDFANDGYQWWQVAELGYDSFMVAQSVERLKPCRRICVKRNPGAKAPGFFGACRLSRRPAPGCKPALLHFSAMEIEKPDVPCFARGPG